MVHSSPSLKRWGFLYIFGFHIGELRFRPPFILIWGFFINHIKFIYQSKKVVKLLLLSKNVNCSSFDSVILLYFYVLK